MNPDLDKLLPYPFERLARLKEGAEPPGDLCPVSLALGEPTHPTPDLIKSELTARLQGLAHYPKTRGTTGLREAVARWLCRRFALPVDSIDAQRNILPVNGTREALFAFAQCIVDRSDDPLVLMPNPFYQIYEGAAYLSGATPWYVNCTAETGFLPDFELIPLAIWRRCQLLYLCSPGNPTGAVIGIEQLQRIIELADRYDFVIAADECYSEIYPDEARPPAGLLQAAATMGRTDYARCVVFHSLSKRSNAPGLRSGFVAGDARVLERFHLYRTYHGCAMAPPVQAASALAWSDETHVIENRRLYREKFDAVDALLKGAMDYTLPDAGFYLWPITPTDDTEFARELFRETNLTVLPGSYLSRDGHGVNPGHRRIRIALVPSLEDCVEAAGRLRQFVGTP